MSRKAYVRPKKRVGEIFRFLHSLISLGHKLKEHPSEKLDNFVLVAHMLRDSVTRREPNLVVENLSRTKRCYNAPHKYLARLANLNQDKIKTSL